MLAPEQATRLSNAAAIIGSVAASLDLTARVCPSCQYTRYDDFEAFKMHKELVAIGAKLNRFVQQINKEGR